MDLKWSPENVERGYHVNLKNVIPNKWKCPLCDLLMKDAIQTYRGEMACESCFLTAKGDSQICPIDKEPIADGEFFKDRHARREIQQLECYCINRDCGCNWEGVVHNFEQHRNNCSYERICCVDCQEFISRISLDHHLKELCQFRKLTCAHCGITLNAQSMKEHEETCPMKPTYCPYKCGEQIQLSSLHTHVQMCAKIVDGEICPYQLVGCRATLEKGLAHHLKEDEIMHAGLAICTVNTLQQSNEKMKNDLTSEQILRLELTSKIEEQSNKQKEMEANMMTWKGKYQEIEAQLTNLKGISDTSVKEIEQSLTEIDLKASGSSMQEIDTKLTVIGQRYDEAEEKLRGNAGAGSADTSSIVFDDDLKKGIQKIDQLESGSAVLSANLSELELKLQLLENTCYDGQQLWKVDNVTYRINQAVTGKVSALHSAPCFEKRGGYKFCSRLYLNGDGMGRGTHVSLFFVIMKSEYDALLQWPFSRRVSFRLINPHNPGDSVRESFIPDRNSSSFKRPNKDMNIAAGCPMFIRKELLSNYVVDDVLYIETKIDPN